jgi:hypothetical protein
MRRFLSRAAVGCAALVVGVVIGSIHQHVLEKRLAVKVAPPSPVQTAPPAALPASPAEDVYPENESLYPTAIEYYIVSHPHADLTRLAERLNIRWQNYYGEPPSSEWHCYNCRAQTFYYNLDDDPDEEVVLQIGSEMTESYEYLIFKSRSYDDSPLLGNISAHSKYKPSRHFVLMSGGKAWLVIQSQVANGSGLAVYDQTIYQVSARGVEPAVTYFSEISQSGFGLSPSRRIKAYPVSCEVKGGKLNATVAYTVDYSASVAAPDEALFRKQQTAVLIATIGHGATRLDTSASDIARHEFETIYNFDSMDEDAFLTYNHSELRSLALGRDRSKKQWLKEYLEECERHPIKRELLSLLR